MPTGQQTSCLLLEALNSHMSGYSYHASVHDKDLDASKHTYIVPPYVVTM